MKSFLWTTQFFLITIIGLNIYFSNLFYWPHGIFIHNITITIIALIYSIILWLYTSVDKKKIAYFLLIILTILTYYASIYNDISIFYSDSLFAISYLIGICIIISSFLISKVIKDDKAKQKLFYIVLIAIVVCVFGQAVITSYQTSYIQIILDVSSVILFLNLILSLLFEKNKNLSVILFCTVEVVVQVKNIIMIMNNEAYRSMLPQPILSNIILVVYLLYVIGYVARLKIKRTV